MTPEQIAAIERTKAKISGVVARQDAAKRALAKISQTPPTSSVSNPSERDVAQITPAPSAAIADELHRQGPVGVRYLSPLAEVEAADGSPQVYDARTGQYTNRELMAARMSPTMTEAIGAGSLQGLTLGAGDEIVAGSSPLQREKIRAATDAARRDHFGASLAGEIGGAVSVPLGSASRAKTLAEAIWRGSKAGAVWGALYGFNQEEGGLSERAKGAARGAVGGFVVGGLAPIALTGAARGLKKVFAKAETTPVIENLRAAKRAAYRAADQAGARFSGAETKALHDDVARMINASDYVSGVDRQTDATLTLLERKAGTEMTLGQLDKMRQGLWKRFNAAPNEVGILDAINAIDDLIDSRAGASSLMTAARAANAAFKKAEMLDLAFQRARDQTAATGSGGNILNKYRQAVTSIINNPKKAKWFDQNEIDVMRKFIQGSLSDNIMRRIGKLAPGGNGLMLALNLGAVSAEPGMLGVTALSSAAKAISDKSTSRGAEQLIRGVSGAASTGQRPVVSTPNALNAYLGSRF